VGILKRGGLECQQPIESFNKHLHYPAERADLLQRLLATFQSAIDPKLDQLWIDEAHARLEAYDRGEIEAVDID